jgi:hypothetical protein
VRQRAVGERDDWDGSVVEFGGQPVACADQDQAPACLVELADGRPKAHSERARTADIGGGQVHDDQVGAGRQVAEGRAEPAERRRVERACRAQDCAEPAAVFGCRWRHDAPEVAIADPDDAVGDEAPDEDEDEDEEVPDDDVLPELDPLELALELAVPAAAALCCAAAGSTTAIAAAAATLVIPAPAVTMASLALPWRLTRRALASSGVAGVSSVDIIDTPVRRDRLLRQPGCGPEIGNPCPESLRRR